jgi:hypothetical protein
MAAATTSFATLVTSPSPSFICAPPLPELSIPGPSCVVCRPSRDRRRRRRRRRHPGSGPSSPPSPPRRFYPSAVLASPHRPSPSPGASRLRPPTAARASSHPPAPNPRLPLLITSSFVFIHTWSGRLSFMETKLRSWPFGQL